MLKIVSNLIPESLWNLKATFGMVPEKLCIHNTANDAPAENEARYVHNNPDATSYHYAVDDTQAVQILPLDRNGWHAGDGSYGPGNRKSVGIEICYSLSGGKRFERAQENAAELCVRLMHEFGWGLDLNRITKHEDYANKHCPHRTLDDYGWDFFLGLVQSKYKTLYEEELPMAKDEKERFDELEKTVKKLQERLDKYDDMGVYDNAAIKWAYNDKNIPDWAKSTVTKLIKKKILQGNGQNSYELSLLMMRILVMLDRAECFG